jgi:molybdate transport system substrate-binding protein
MALVLISSMATRKSLAELAASYAASSGSHVDLVSIGGVDAARRVRAGEVVDVVVLAGDALHKLAAEGFVTPDSVACLARSPTALAVRTGAPRPETLDERALDRLLSEVRSIGVSSGPSGTLLRRLISARPLGKDVADRIVEAPPGQPVAHMVADGTVEIGFQQLSELVGEPGVDVVGTLPDDLVPLTEFCAGRATASRQPHAADRLIDHLRAPASRAAFERRGFLGPL